MNLVPRDGWGAKPPKAVTVDDHQNEAYLHHTAGSGGGASYMQSMQNYHMGKGWNDIAYNFVIDPEDLIVYEGRGLHVRPGAQKSHNMNTIAICVMGDWSSKNPPAALLETIADVLEYAHAAGAAPKYLTGGHRDAPGQSTSCPGNLANYIDEINGIIDGNAPFVPPPTQPPTEPDEGTLMQISRVQVSDRQNDRHPDVRIAQSLLTGFSPTSPGTIDGVAGPKFTDSVKAYQSKKGLSPDGIVGPKTWGKLEDTE